MDKQEILERSRKENEYQDERDEQIELKACKAGLNTIILSTCGLYLLLKAKSRFSGSGVEDWYLLLLPMWANMAGACFVKWRSYKKKRFLAWSVLAAVMVLLVFQLRLFGPIR